MIAPPDTLAILVVAPLVVVVVAVLKPPLMSRASRAGRSFRVRLLVPLVVRFALVLAFGFGVAMVCSS